MQLERLAPALAPADIRNPAPVEIADLAYDTRAVGPGALFFCVRGSRADGHELAEEALSRGAVALVVEHARELPVPQLVVLVVVNEPRNAIWGGVVAAPAFSQIASYDLQYLEVPPDAGGTRG